MDKKGQVYIIAAILLSVVLFAMASVTNAAKQEKFKGDFEKLSNNYENEGTRLVNTIINTGEDVGARFGNFTYAFTSYSKTQNWQFGLIYVLDYNGRVHIGDYLADSIDVGYIEGGTPKTITLSGCFKAVGSSITFESLTKEFTSVDPGLNLANCVKDIAEPADKKVHIAIKNSWYPFKLVPGKPQLMIVSQMEQEEQRKVFVRGEGFLRGADFCTELNQEQCKNLKIICKYDVQSGTCKKKVETIEDLGNFYQLNLSQVGMGMKTPGK